MRLVVDLFQSGYWIFEMIIISHRGNLDGPDPSRENNPDYIDEAIAQGFDVEVDVRLIDYKFYLGHDEPQYPVPIFWLFKRKDNLWIHCKDLKSLNNLSSNPVDFNYFWHDTDKYTLTSKGIGWVLVGEKPFENSIVVLPELMKCYDTVEEKYAIIKNTKGICTDKPLFYQKELGVNK